MKPTILLLSALLALPAFAASEGAYSVEILVDGRPLHEYNSRGATYIEALEGRDYAVRLNNHTRQRVAVALSVDGLNSIDAKTTTARDASKWILGPHDSITIEGWQISGAKARRFFFTTEDRSYGEWLGKTDNLGIISAAFFREKRPRPVPYSRQEKNSQRRDAGDSPRAGRMNAPEAEGLSDDHAATGIGEKIDHRVQRVRFDAERRPASVVNIRYEYRDALVRLGVLPEGSDPLSRRERARGFEDTGFAPDPWGR